MTKKLPEYFEFHVGSRAVGRRFSMTLDKRNGQYCCEFLNGLPVNDGHGFWSVEAVLYQLENEEWTFAEGFGFLETFAIETPTGNQYDLTRRQDGDYDMVGARGESWIRTALQTEEFLANGAWKRVDGAAKHSTIMIDGRVYEACVMEAPGLMDAFLAYGRALEDLERFRKP